MKRLLYIAIGAIFASPLLAKVDLTTLPSRETVQITIYNSADLTLVREARPLTLKNGLNNLQFSWENTLIDPTSLEMFPRAHADAIDIAELVYPPRVKNLGLWNITSEVAGKVPVEITYFTSGLTWRAFYMGTLTPDEKTMQLQGYVRVTNNSGEDYENAQTRLIVGKVHLLDEIAALARRQYPYGSPVQPPPPVAMPAPARAPEARARYSVARGIMTEEPALPPKEIQKEGLSEYFLYTIEGTETIPTGWSKRLPSMNVAEIPVVNLYKFDEQRFGRAVVRYLSFKNDQQHKLGETPIPGGLLKVYRNLDPQQHLAYIGQSSFKYIPVDEDVELNLGGVADVVVEPTLMDYQTENFRFNNDRNVTGWDDVQQWKIEVRNTRDLTVKVEVYRHFGTQYWNIKNSGETGVFEKEDLDTIKYTLTLEPQAKQTFQYVLRMHQGTRQEDWKDSASASNTNSSNSYFRVKPYETAGL
ncbi:MAG: DUF4139 domain-containing protein [Sedimentisphaerales bacterium]|nr:DUF4139 domain-containing protein [Sedimentisphaerales bacterium]